MEFAEYLEISDVYKVLFSLLAGVVLGLEREMKDKSAGLKTITIICLGSTLFTLMSYKFAGDDGDPTRIASYIVSGIGFLGAGVIFKEGFNVHGLTTAGIIWMAAAIGMSIGFGEIALGFIFLAISFVVIYIARYFNNFFIPQHTSKLLKYEISMGEKEVRKEISADILKIADEIHKVITEKRDQQLFITLDINIREKKLKELEEYLLKNDKIKSFTL